MLTHTCVPQHFIWAKCRERQQARTAALDAHGVSAQQRDVAQRTHVHEDEERMRSVCVQQKNAVESVCVAAHRAAAALRDARLREDVLLQEGWRTRCAHEQARAGARAARVAAHKFSADHRQRTQCDVVRAAEQQRKCTSALQHAAFEEVCEGERVVLVLARKREHAQQLAAQRVTDYAYARLERDAAQRRDAEALEDSRRAVAMQQLYTRDSAVRQKEEEARARTSISHHRESAAQRDKQQSKQVLQQGWRSDVCKRQTKVCEEVRVREARRIEIREAALVAKHTRTAEERDLSVRKRAMVDEGGEGWRGRAAVGQESVWRACMEEEHRRQRACKRQEVAARETVLIEAHELARQEKEFQDREVKWLQITYNS